MELRPGMTFTIEPMINVGEWDVKMLKDGWTAVTKDKSLSAQFEHTLVLLKMVMKSLQNLLKVTQSLLTYN